MKPMIKKSMLFLLLLAIAGTLFAVPAFSAATGSTQTAASGLLPLATTTEIQATDTFVEAANKIKTPWSKTWGTETKSGTYQLKDYLDTSKMDGTAHCLDCDAVLSLPKCASCGHTMSWSSYGLTKCTNAKCANAYSASKGTDNYVVANDTCSSCGSKNIDYRWYDIPTTRQPDSNDPTTSDLISVKADGTQIIMWTPTTSVCGDGRRACAPDIQSYLAIRFGDTEAMLYSNRAGHLAKPLYSSSSYYSWSQEWTNAGRTSTKSVIVAYYDKDGTKLGASTVATARQKVTEYAVNPNDSSATFVAVDNATLRKVALAAAPKGYDDNSGHMEIEGVEAFTADDMKSFTPSEKYTSGNNELNAQWSTSSDCCSYVSHSMYSYFSVMSQVQVDAGKANKNAVKFLPSSILTCPSFQYMYNYLTLSEGTSEDSDNGDISNEISRFNKGTNAIVGSDTSSPYWSGNNYERYRAWANCFEAVQDASYMQPGDIMIYYADAKSNVGHVEIFTGWVDENDKMAGIYVLSAGSNTAIRGTYDKNGYLTSAAIKRMAPWNQSNLTEHSATSTSIYGLIGILRMKTGTALADALNAISASSGMTGGAMSNYVKPATAKYTVSLNLNLPSGETVETVMPLNGELDTTSKTYIRTTTTYTNTNDDLAPLTMHAGETEQLPIASSHKTFLGWNTKADGTGTSYAPGASMSPTSDVQLYAQWGEAGTYYVKYYMNADIASGSSTQNDAATYNDAKMKSSFGDRGVYGTDENGAYVKVAYSLGSSYSGAKSPTTCGFIANEGFSVASSVWSTTKSGKDGKTFAPTTGAMAKGAITYSDGSTEALTNDSEIELYAQWSVGVWYVKFHMNTGYVAGEKTSVASATWDESAISTKIAQSRIETGVDADGQWVKVRFSSAVAQYSAIHPSNFGFSAATGFSFGEKYWNTKADGTGRSFVSDTGVFRCLSMRDTDGAILTVGKGSTVDLYLQTERKYTTVTFDANGGTGTMAQFTYCAADKNNKLPLNSYSREGYSFNGWNASEKGNGQSFEDGAKIEGKVPSKLYAQWSPNKYTLAFDLNGGTEAVASLSDESDQDGDTGTVAPLSVEYDQTVTLPMTEVSREGFTFVGWSTSPNGTVAYAAGAKMKYSEVGDLTLYAIWLEDEAEKPKCTISYDANGGTGSMESVSGVDLATYTCPENGFVRDYYDFLGWSLSSTNDGVTITPSEPLGMSVTEGTDLVLHAIWKEQSQLVDFSLSAWFSGEEEKGGKVEPIEISTSRTYKYTGSYTLPTAIDMGWDELDIKWKTEDGRLLSPGATVTNFRVMADDGTEVNLHAGEVAVFCLEAILQKTDVVVSFDTNGGTGSVDGFETKNDNIIMLPKYDGENEGMIFAGWMRYESDNDTTSLLPPGSYYQFSSNDYGAVTFTAMWKSPQTSDITLVFKSDKTGEEFSVSSTDGLLTTPALFETAGFDLAGWRSESTDRLIRPNTTISVSGFSDNDVLVGEWTEKQTESGAPEQQEEQGTTWVTVSFDSDGGTAMEPLSVPYDAKYGELPTPSKTGYQFLGWFLGDEMITEESIVSTDSEHVLKASWKPISYKLRLFPNDGQDTCDVHEMTYDKETVLPTSCGARDGYKFVGWNTKEDGTGTAYEGGQTIKNLAAEEGAVFNLYAQWEAVGSAPRQDVAPNANSGSTSKGSSAASTSTAQTGDSFLGIAGTLVLCAVVCTALLVMIRRREQG